MDEPVTRGRQRHAALSVLRVCVVVLIAATSANPQTNSAVPISGLGSEPVLVPQTAHSGPVMALAFSPDGQTLASGAEDGLVAVWDLGTERMRQAFVGHAAPVVSISFSPDGRVLASGALDGAVLLWDVVTGDPYTAIPRQGTGVWLVTFSPDGRVLASGQGHTLKLWDVESGDLIRTIDLNGRWAAGVDKVVFSSDWTFLAVSNGSGGVALLDPETGETLGSLNLTSNAFSRIVGMALSPDGALLAVSLFRYDLIGNSHRVWFCETATGKVWHHATGRGIASVQGGAITGGGKVAYSPDGSTLASSGVRAVTLEDLTTRSATNTLHAEANITCLAFSPDGQLLAANAGNGVVLWDIATGERSVLEGKVSAVRDVSFADDTTLVCEGADAAAAHDISTGWPVWTRSRTDVATDTFAYVDPATGKVMDRAPAEGKLASELLGTAVLSPANHALAASPTTNPAEQRIIVWDTRTREVIHRLGSHTGPVRALAFSHDGRVLASGGMDCTVILWDTGNWEVLQALQGHQPPISALSFSPDDRVIASGTAVPIADNDAAAADSTVYLWDAGTGEMLTSLKGSPGTVVALAFSPDGRRLASVNRYGTVVVWDLNTGQVYRTIRGGGGYGHCLALSSDGHLLALGGTDGAVHLWQVDANRELAAFVDVDRGQQWLTVTPQGYYDCSLEAARYVVWRMTDRLYPFDQFEEKYRRPDLVQRALAGEDISAAPPLDATQIPPTVWFARPGYGASVDGESVEVEIQAAGTYPIAKVDLSVNGRPVPGEVGRALGVGTPEQTERTVLVRVPLPPNEPQVRLRATAYDTELLKSRPAELLLRRTGVKRTPATVYLLSIGVSRYQNAKWNTLRYADNDALAFAYAFEPAEQHEALKLRVLTNEDATASKVRFGLRWLKDDAAEGDVAVVFVAGHGIERAGEYYFLCYDTMEADLAGSSLSWQEFVNILRDVRAKRLLLFVDTCHAGFAIGRRTADLIVDRLNRKASALVLSASRGEEVSVEGREWGHGAFTESLLEALGGRADRDGDGKISLQELGDFVYSRVEDLTQGKQHPCFPRLQEFGPEAVIAKVVRSSSQ